MGLSFGSFTALCLLGGRPDLSELPRYRERHGISPCSGRRGLAAECA